MAWNNGELNLFLLKADGLVRCRWDGESENVLELNSALEGETVREVVPDPFNPNRLYAATLTEIHVSEDGGAIWQWLPSGGIDHRDIWTMAAHPTRANEIYVGTLPAAVFVSEKRWPLVSRAVGVSQPAGLWQVDLSTGTTCGACSMHCA